MPYYIAPLNLQTTLNMIMFENRSKSQKYWCSEIVDVILLMDCSTKGVTRPVILSGGVGPFWLFLATISIKHKEKNHKQIFNFFLH